MRIPHVKTRSSEYPVLKELDSLHFLACEFKENTV